MDSGGGQSILPAGGSPKVSTWQAEGYLCAACRDRSSPQQQQQPPRESQKLLQAAARTRVGNTESSWLSVISVLRGFVCLIFVSPC